MTDSFSPHAGEMLLLMGAGKGGGNRKWGERERQVGVYLWYVVFHTKVFFHHFFWGTGQPACRDEMSISKHGRQCGRQIIFFLLPVSPQICMIIVSPFWTCFKMMGETNQLCCNSQTLDCYLRYPRGGLEDIRENKERKEDIPIPPCLLRRRRSELRDQSCSS